MSTAELLPPGVPWKPGPAPGGRALGFPLFSPRESSELGARSSHQEVVESGFSGLEGVDSGMQGARAAEGPRPKTVLCCALGGSPSAGLCAPPWGFWVLSGSLRLAPQHLSQAGGGLALLSQEQKEGTMDSFLQNAAQRT